MYTPGPAISFFTCFWLFPQKEHFSRSDSPNLAISPVALSCPATGGRVGRLSRAVGAAASYLCRKSAAAEDLVDTPVVLGLLGSEDEVAVGVLRDLLDRLAGVLGDDLLEQLPAAA